MMRMVDLIAKKRDGGALTKEEIAFFIDGYTTGDIPDYQVSSMMMAIFFQDMTEDERANLTMAMVKSGDEIDLSAIEGIKVDKHSTGGVGDTTTLVLAPLVAALDVPVAKMSGRGLGHTGGTIDKLEAVSGFHTEITEAEFAKIVNRDKVAVIGQSGNLTPADKKLYALRDVTATVNSIPLIASSIMSKKIAAGADAIVLDVKTGSGAFMKTEEASVELAQAMVSIGNNVGRKTMAVISSMSEPLGYAIGNALEIKEAIETLRGEGPADLTRLCMELGAQMVVAGGKAETLEEAKEKLQAVIDNGQALEKFKVFLSNQGGDASVADDVSKLPQSDYLFEVKADTSGYIEEIAAEEIGVASAMLGAGRQTKDDAIDLAVGLMLKKKTGDHVAEGETIAVIHSNREDVGDVERKILDNYTIGNNRVEIDLVKQHITE